MPDRKQKPEEKEQPNKKRKRVPIYTAGIGTRISDTCERIGSKRLAAQTVEISEDMIYRYIREDANPAIEVVAALAAAGDVSLQWLATGKLHQPTGGSDSSDARAEETFVQVPQYDVEVAAGDGRVPGDEEVLAYYAFRRDWVRQRGWTPGDLAIVICRGDSQEGLIDDGQPVLVNLGDTDISTEGLFVLRRDDTLLIKTVQLDFQGNALLRSNNPRYREIQVPREQITDIQIVGRAIWTDHVL